MGRSLVEGEKVISVDEAVLRSGDEETGHRSVHTHESSNGIRSLAVLPSAYALCDEKAKSVGVNGRRNRARMNRDEKTKVAWG
jgi:hypothetical protein